MTKKRKGLAGGLTHMGDPDFALYMRKAFASSMGYSKAILEKPVIGIVDTTSGFNNCHRGVPDLIEAAKRGVLAAGGLPISFPTISLGESFVSPTTLMFRNLMSMDVEEMIRAQPMDAVILIGGCDKTVPALLMGAVSADKPAILLVTGPMMTSRHGNERLGACTDCRRFWAQYRAGDLSRDNIEKIGARLCTTAGTCPVMGTASTMACLAETLGMTLPGTAAIPAVHADRLRAAEASGTRAVGLAAEGLKPSAIVTKAAVDNALRVLLAIGGSTNGILHLAAIAGRAGIDLPLDDLNAISDTTPVLVDLKPTGPSYMEDLHATGGLAPVLRALRPLLDLETVSVTGVPLSERLDGDAETADIGIVKSLEKPLQPEGGLIALFGSLAPGGAILKRSAADSRLFEHEGCAVVFSSLDDLARRIDDPDLDVAADDILVLQNAGPKSGTGMPEAGYLPIPGKLAKAGVKDMIRISDARMSGTAFGTIILHVTPEAALAGPLGLVRSGDRIRLSVQRCSLDLLVSEDELAARRQAHQPPAAPARGYAKLYHDHVLAAPAGCDFDFLRSAG